MKDEVGASGPWPAVPTYLEFCNDTGRNEGLVRVFSPNNWMHVHYRDPRAPAGSASVVKVVPPGSVGVLAIPVDAQADAAVVGVSVKGACMRVRATVDGIWPERKHLLKFIPSWLLGGAAMSATEAPFLAEVELCGSVFPVDPHWRCYNEPPLDGEEAWLLPTFDDDDDGWRPATWAPRSVAVPATAQARRHFEKGARFVLPAPVLDAQAEAAWRAWDQTKAEANEAWRAWRAAKEGGERARPGNATNGTSAAASTSESMERSGGGTNHTLQYIASMRGGGGGGGNKPDGDVEVEAPQGGTNASSTTAEVPSSLDWKDHAPNANDGLQRLEWHKPRPAAAHGYYCRLEFPNPARAYARELQGSPGASLFAGAGASG